MSDNKCAQCGKPVLGRSDKIFCSTECRTRKNNDRKAETDEIFYRTNKILRKNRSILRKLCPHDHAVVPRKVVVEMGLDVTRFTSVYVTKRKEVYYFSYDYAFMPVIKKGEECALIVKQNHEMAFPDPWKTAELLAG